MNKSKFSVFLLLMTSTFLLLELTEAKGIAGSVTVLSGTTSIPAMAKIRVNTTGDLSSKDGLCSLREAVINANDNAATYPDCTAGSKNDVIQLTAGLTYYLTRDEDSAAGDETGDLDISSNVQINVKPSSGTATIDASGAKDRAIEIIEGSDVSLKNLIITGGHHEASLEGEGGGGIRIADATVNLTNVTVSGNEAEGMGAFTMMGGGIEVIGTLNLDSSTVSDNTISNSGSGGSIGGGIGGMYATINIVNSTISGNSVTEGDTVAGGGIANPWGGSTTSLSNSTISNNVVSGDNNAYGGGIYGNETTLKSTIISGNSVSGATTSGEECYEGDYFSYGYNFMALSGTFSNCTLTEMDNAGTDILSKTHTDLKLKALADNGGLTKTMALEMKSSAIDKGSCLNQAEDSSITDDQRDVARGSLCDIGAYERGAIVSGTQTPATTSTLPVLTNSK